MILFLWLAFLVRGAFYVNLLPLWEGFDEWSHYAVVQNLASSGAFLPDRHASISREVQESLSLIPWQPGLPDAKARHDAYWQLPGEQRAIRERQLTSLPPELAVQPAAGGPKVYEAQQAPLDYWLMLPVYRRVAAWPLLSRVWALRFAALLIASSLVPVGFWIARRTAGAEFAVAIMAVVVAQPQLMITVTHISNDVLAVAMGTLLCAALLYLRQSPRSWLSAFLLGIALGLSLLTKAYFLAVVPAILLAAWFWAGPRQLLTVTSSAAVLSAWWYIRNLVTTHSISGEQVDLGGLGSRLSFTQAMQQMNWWKAADVVFLSHVWLGNWSFLVVRSWMYRTFAVIACAAALGLVLRLVLRSKYRPELLAFLALYGSFLFALAYHSVRNFQTTSFTGTLGHYLFPLVVPEAIFLTIGLGTLLPARLAAAVPAFLIACLSALEFFGVHCYLMGYYSGLTSYAPNGNLPALTLGAVRAAGVHQLFERLTIDKPAFLTARLMAVSWAIFLAVNLAILASAAIAAARVARSRHKPA